MPTATSSILGTQLIGSTEVSGPSGSATFEARNPTTGEQLAGTFTTATAEQVDLACELARAASRAFRSTTPEARAAFLEAIAEELLALGNVLVERAVAETGLPPGRIEGERGRTVGQLRMFASALRAGRFFGVTMDTPLPDRKPLPRPSLATVRIPVGPVAVFGASNFPLAFSVAGGDTASALAAGCPVVVRAHPAHPGTAELAGRAIQQAASRTGMPEGVFSLLTGAGYDLGEAVVTHPSIRAVGFTGSRNGGLALAALAAERVVPIPVFAEMSSVNPVFVLPGALRERAEAIGKGLAASILLGVGQFCTNPGIVFGIEGPEWESFQGAAGDAVRSAPAATMLHSGIAEAYLAAASDLARHGDITIVAEGQKGNAGTGCALLCATTAEAFLEDPSLAEEIFGPTSLLVRCSSLEEMIAAAHALEGQLTCTLHFSREDHEAVATLLPVLEETAGRLVANGFPTGVEVGTAMVHGGPYPATTDARFTSVGTMSVERWLRPVCYQDFPEDLLPHALQTGNPLNIPRIIDGQ